MLSPDFDISTNSLPVLLGEKAQDLSQFVALRLTQVSPVAFRENRQQKDRNVRTAVIANNARATSPAFRLRAPAKLPGATRALHQLAGGWPVGEKVDKMPSLSLRHNQFFTNHIFWDIEP